ncbi:hypothetical protein, partial [Streptococcus sobrinus]|uniref:hypothetical protein n=1 Tax=Streptococcus sobrinus TaxID=1310 RepID=UPI0005B52136
NTASILLKNRVLVKMIRVKNSYHTSLIYCLNEVRSIIQFFPPKKEIENVRQFSLKLNHQ